MRNLFVVFACVCTFALVGCEQKPEPVATTEDQCAAYDQMMAVAEAETAAEESADADAK